MGTQKRAGIKNRRAIMSFTFDYLYLFAFFGGYTVKWWQVAKPLSFYLMLIILIAVIVWFYFQEGKGDDGGFNDISFQLASAKQGRAVDCDNSDYFYNADGLLNICIRKAWENE